MTDQDSFDGFLDEVERTLGPIDVLINNAGIMPTGKLVDEPDPLTRRILDINVYGVILGCKLVLRRMLPRGSGHIINIASLAGETHIPGLATYNASKHAVLGFTDTLREEYRGTGVRFSSVLPTLTNTELGSGVTAPKLLRPAEPEEIADAVRRADRQAEVEGAGDRGGRLHLTVRRLAAGKARRRYRPGARVRAGFPRRRRRREAQSVRGARPRGVNSAPSQGAAAGIPFGRGASPCGRSGYVTNNL